MVGIDIDTDIDTFAETDIDTDTDEDTDIHMYVDRDTRKAFCWRLGDGQPRARRPSVDAAKAAQRAGAGGGSNRFGDDLLDQGEGLLFWLLRGDIDRAP